MDQDATAIVDAAGQVLHAYGLDTVADLARNKLDPQRQLRTVVVAGEVQRGKSSLVNALVGRPGLSPVGVEAATAITISVTHNPAQAEPVIAELYLPSGARQVDPVELAEWVTVDGARVNDPMEPELATAAAVGVASARLDSVTVVDTPGVGGLDTGLARLAAQSAQQACVLLLVCDASTPLTALEMDFVRGASANVDSVIVVVTKTDKNLRRWRGIVAENERILERELGRPIPVMGVSSLLAELAESAVDVTERTRLEAASGIVELRRAVAERLDRVADLPGRDAVQTALSGLNTVRTRISAELGDAQAGEAALPGLDADIARLTDLERQSREWEQYLARDLTLLRQTAVDELDRRLDTVRDKWTNYINKNGMEVLRRREQQFTADMLIDLQQAMSDTVGDFVEQLRDQVIAPRFTDDPTVWADLSEQIAATLENRRIEAHQVASKRHGLFDPTLLTMGVVGSSTLGGLLGLSALMGVGLGVGVLWIGVNIGFRAARAGKANLLNWLRETIGATKGTTARLLEAVVAQVRPEIVIRYREYLRVAIVELQARIAELKSASQIDAAVRAKKIARLQANLEVVDKRVAVAQRYLDTEPSPTPVVGA